MSDEYDEIFNKIKKMLNLGDNFFDIDFYFMPESIYRKEGFKFDPNDKNIKGFKVSYHYETGMDEPEIKIEGDIDKTKLQDYLNNLENIEHFKLTNLKNKKTQDYLDAGKLTLKPHNQKSDQSVVEPYTEINEFDEFSEIIIEVPGIKKEDIKIEFEENARKLLFLAENNVRKYYKELNLPLDTSSDVYTLEVNNGIATIKVMHNH